MYEHTVLTSFFLCVLNQISLWMKNNKELSHSTQVQSESFYIILMRTDENNTTYVLKSRTEAAKGNNEKLWWNDENEKYKNLCWLEHVAIHKTEAVRGNEEKLCCDEMMNEDEK